MGEEIYVCLRGRVLFKLVPVSKPVRPHFINSDADEAEIRARSSGEVDSKEGWSSGLIPRFFQDNEQTVFVPIRRRFARSTFDISIG